jgi:RNA polymerase sigma factor (sigma-70 family)
VASGRAGVASRHLQALFSVGTAAGLADGELLERFASRRDAAAEAAFAALVERHGPMVLRVCRDVLRNEHDAADAFQATFLVLVRRAGSIRKGDSVASWLYGVALRVASVARSSASRRRLHERKAAAMEARLDGGRPRDDLEAVLHEEVGRLPEKYRAAVVLCYWQGLTHEQAAEQLSWPVGTVRSRLAWARGRLRSRLIRRGLAPSVALSAAASSAEAAPMSVPAVLVKSTAHAASRLATGQAAAGVVSATAAVMTEGVIRTMMLAKWKTIAAAALAVGITTTGAIGLGQPGPGDQPAAAPATTEPTKAPPLDEAANRDAQIQKLREIQKLRDYYHQLEEEAKRKEEEWRRLVKKGTVDPGEIIRPKPGDDGEAGEGREVRQLPARMGITLEECRRVREQLVQVGIDLIQAEALLAMLQAEADGTAPVDNDLRLKAQVEEAFRSDPDAVRLYEQMEKIDSGLEKLTRSVRDPSSDPSVVAARRSLEGVKAKIERLWEAKEPVLRARLAADIEPQQGGVIDESFPDDPEVIAVVDEIAKTASELAAKMRRAGKPRNPEALALAINLKDKTLRYQQLWGLKSIKPRANPKVKGDAERGAAGLDLQARIAEAAAQVSKLRIQKASLESMLSQIEVRHQKEASDVVDLALVQEALDSLREMKAAVKRRLYQLQFDTRASREQDQGSGK